MKDTSFEEQIITNTSMKNQSTTLNQNLKKIILLFSLLITIDAFSQIPSYLSPNSLVGCWPFNGNTNDVSGNGNNGVLNGASLTKDRRG